ncbi:Tn3 family transposase, partial [Klebsiella pneumoniae]|uniref:Tn3 family transposase n=1 Tax=Klebsiella pneumoniae TaxID=573 RepID=UPI003BA07D10
MADLVNAWFRHPFAEHWATAPPHRRTARTSRTGGSAGRICDINPKYRSSPGRTFYTHISDQYAPFHTKVVN